MHRLMPSMGGVRTLIQLSLAFILFVAIQYYHSTITVQDIESVHFRFKPAQPNSRSDTRFVLPARVNGEKTHMRRSGPNPVGNHRPPSRQ
ncbi:CLAVATA3/ESR (CLE)-related protein 46 [Cannabis sativa]|uniref:CLAVATA3/ESR (CLE)-related protein 46 n=1 Tax=Cannabis sativa TaxID=3483 RepID=UPI0029CA54F2|nr:CLAVATA3/ESR (CLE)-related protein 46 [Cannabis sativa]